MFWWISGFLVFLVTRAIGKPLVHSAACFVMQVVIINTTIINTTNAIMFTNIRMITTIAERPEESVCTRERCCKLGEAGCRAHTQGICNLDNCIELQVDHNAKLKHSLCIALQVDKECKDLVCTWSYYDVSISVCDIPGVRLQHGAVGSRNCLAARRWKDWMLDRSHQKSHQKCHQTRHKFHPFKTKWSSLYLHLQVVSNTSQVSHFQNKIIIFVYHLQLSSTTSQVS